MRRLVLTALLALTPSALAATQYAVLKGVTVQGGVATLTLDYVDVYGDTDADARRVVALGDYPDAQAYFDANPGGLYVRNVNPMLRTLKTDARTLFHLSCLDRPGGVQVVPLATFVSAWTGRAPQGCWPFSEKVVALHLSGSRVLKVEQVYFP
ncbi:hypothetical protein [Deinococcus sedimenti]|uniref:Uncharacterized protein n=1 Tax=Deinococcus sedimenti TaxID=1867090 RepID=A0ABQ2S2B1_9DEIO|nr:hypothetical protein [Deinococcus sedimenti]GGR81664.1 hypothetical protein GCM10008960_05800 [Deinococcus sedimenti]